MSRQARLLLSLSLIAFAGACDSDEIAVPKVVETNFAASLGVDLANSTRTASGLYYRDITVGGGILVPADTAKRVTIAYVGTLRNGLQFDAGTIVFTTDAGTAIAGMNEGVKGMRVGGVRQLVIAPALGYGSEGNTGIPPNSILVFRVTLLSIG